MTTDEKWMRRCLQLARQGEQGAPPNPMVGAVIVADGRIIGEGYHARCGEGHAEVNAFASVSREDLLPNATIYVTLEPCAHYGKTPPCAELIIRKGVRRVVVGCLDPFPQVSGRGVDMIRKAGIEVTVGVLETECRWQIRKFLIPIFESRPYITLKWAQSADGFIAPNAVADSHIFVSTPATQRRAHHLRATHQAVLVGRQTALADNPSLTLRHWSGRNPLRVVIDTHHVLPSSLHLFDNQVPTLIVDEPEDTLGWLMRELTACKVQSLLVEGGANTISRFVEAGIWDELHVEVGNRTFGGGTPAPQWPKTVDAWRETLDGHTVWHAYRPNMCAGN